MDQEMSEFDEFALKVSFAFAEKYYDVMQNSFSELHKFYAPKSRLTCTTTPNSLLKSVVGTTAIQEHLTTLGFEGVRVDIEEGTMDAQYCQDGSIMTAVTGIFLFTNSPASSFLQIFKLSSEDGQRFYVANDMIRLLPLPKLYERLENTQKQFSPHIQAKSNVVDSKEPAAKPTQAATQESQVEVTTPNDNTTNTSNEVVHGETLTTSPVPTKQPETSTPAPTNPEVKPQPSSWASVAAKGATVQAPVKKTILQENGTVKGSSDSKQGKDARSGKHGGKPNKEGSRSGTEIVVKEFPKGTTPSQVESLLKAYGDVVAIEQSRSRPEMYVTFKTQDSVKKVLADMSKLVIGDKTIQVQQRTSGENGGNRGRKGGRSGGNGGNGNSNNADNSGKSRSRRGGGGGGGASNSGSGNQQGAARKNRNSNINNNSSSGATGSATGSVNRGSR